MIIAFLTAVVLGTWMVKSVNTSEPNKIDVSSSCFRTHIEISFLLESFPGVNLSMLHLRDPLCKPTRNSTHVTFKAPLFGCETRLVEISKNSYIFDNVVGGVRPSIKVTCDYPIEYLARYWYKGKGEYSSELTMFQDSQLARHIPSGGVVRFESPIPKDLFFDLQIIPKQENMRVCLFVQFCGIFVQDKVLSLIENGQGNKMTTQVIFTSTEHTIFRFNASLLVTSIDLNTKLKVVCIVNGYHDNSTQENKGCNDDKHHGNASDCQELKGRQDSMDRNSTSCNCEQHGAPMATGQADQRRGGCDQICVSGSTGHSNGRKSRRKRAAKEQSSPSVVSQDQNKTARPSYGLSHNNSDIQDPSSNDVSTKIHLCSSSEWDGKPVLLRVEREWVARPSVPQIGLKWTEKHEEGHVSRNKTNGANKTEVVQAVWPTEERTPSAALLLACSYLSLLLVIGPVLLVYLWDRRNHKKRRRQRTRYARSYSGARLLLNREQSIA